MKRSNIRQWSMVTVLAATAIGCGTPTPDDIDVEETNGDALTWVAPLANAEIEVGDFVELSLSTTSPAARAVRFVVDGAEIAVCDPTLPESDCHVADLWRWTYVFNTAGEHTIEASYQVEGGQPVRTVRTVNVLPAGTLGDPSTEEAPEGDTDPLTDEELIDEGEVESGQALTARRGFLDPNRGWHNIFGGIQWSVSGQRVLLRSGRLDGSVSTVARCLATYGASIRRYADLYKVSRGAVIATAITESNCTNPRGSSDGLSSGPMQVTGSTCAAVTGLSSSTCRSRMHTSPDFSFQVGVRYIASSYQRRQHVNDPPKISAAYNAGSLRRTSSNRWRMVTTGNHIDRFVAAYNAYRTWERRQGIALEYNGPEVTFNGAHVPSQAAMPTVATEGTSVFVGDWSQRNGEFYTFTGGRWVSN